MRLKMENKNNNLTVAIITKNEEQNLKECLENIQPLECPIVVIDSGSTDNTLQIAQQYGADIHIFDDWQGFGVQRNRAHSLIKTDWVLWLDADECLTEQTRQDLLIKISETSADGKVVFSINRLTVAYGKKIYHCGYYPDWVVRLYPVKKYSYTLDLVHETVQLSSETQIIPLAGNVLHKTYTNLNQYLEKMQHYTNAWAIQNKGNKKSHPFLATVKALFTFLKIYLLKRGFLDGSQGLIIAIMGAIYTFVKYTQLWLLNQEK